MSATRKLYREIATSISYQVKAAGDEKDILHTIAAVTRAVADDLKRDNSAFLYHRFFEAAGLDEFGYPPKVKS